MYQHALSINYQWQSVVILIRRSSLKNILCINNEQLQPEYKHNHCLFTLKYKTAINYERKTIRMDFFLICKLMLLRTNNMLFSILKWKLKLHLLLWKNFFTKNLRHSYTLQVDVYIVNTVYINKDGNIKHLFFLDKMCSLLK